MLTTMAEWSRRRQFRRCVHFAMAACATLVRSRLSMQLVLTTPVCNLTGSCLFASKWKYLAGRVSRPLVDKSVSHSPTAEKVLFELRNKHTDAIPTHILAFTVEVEVFVFGFRHVGLECIAQ